MDTRYDYDKQAWIEDGRYVRCHHPEAMDCDCYGKLHAGEVAPAPLRTIDLIIRHYRDSGNAPYSVKELLGLYGREWLKDAEQVIKFERWLCICRDGIIRKR